MRTVRVNRTLRNAGILAVAFAALTVASGSVTGTAHAESGRRLCVYTENEDGWRELRDNRQYNAYVAVDYKKDGACPRVTVSPDKFRWRVGAQPVKKIRCEDWPAKANPWPGTDVCTHLPADAVWEARVYDDGKGVGSAIYGSVWQFQ
ncbi:hypothetical protein SGFS_024030 [Streptomyces graminofaciens]|uniref:Secreted protein n=1 Tax=Streptomyces graminofaciens TaxID=68212 RepID=A0ABM7F5J4_9ACTN|nr:hypothetical protein [Streptomyces graminofaciens]BBC31109.1 hypothetical protein SGFS_024030 [Streptomyces graminofaciens]